MTTPVISNAAQRVQPAAIVTGPDHQVMKHGDFLFCDSGGVLCPFSANGRTFYSLCFLKARAGKQSRRNTATHWPAADCHVGKAGLARPAGEAGAQPAWTTARFARRLAVTGRRAGCVADEPAEGVVPGWAEGTLDSGPAIIVDRTRPAQPLSPTAERLVPCSGFRR